MKSRKHLGGGRWLKSVSCCVLTLVRKHSQNSVTVTETVTSSMQRHLDTAGSLENSGAGEANRTLVISLGG
jgi:hypothetical protein